LNENETRITFDHDDDKEEDGNKTNEKEVV